MSDPSPPLQPEPEPPTPLRPLVTARQRERSERDDADPLPPGVKARLRGIPSRMHILQVAGRWIGGVLFGATVVMVPCLVQVTNPLALVRILTTPALSFFCYSWSARLDESPARFGAGICGMAACLAITNGIDFVSTLSVVHGPHYVLLLGLLALMFLGPFWLAMIYLWSLRLLFLYAHARVEFPIAVGSLWSPAERRRTRQLLHSARWWPVLLGFFLAPASLHFLRF